MRKYAELRENILSLTKYVNRVPVGKVKRHKLWPMLLEKLEQSNEVNGYNIFESKSNNKESIFAPKFISGFTDNFFDSIKLNSANIGSSNNRGEPFFYKAHWSSGALGKVYVAENLVGKTKPEKLLEIALAIAKEILFKESGLALFSGPISTGGLGSIDENLRYFNKGIAEASRKGYNMFCQMPFEELFKAIHYEHEVHTSFFIKHFYKPLFKSNRISLLLQAENWESSSGACEEAKLCDRFGIERKGVDFPIILPQRKNQKAQVA